MSQVRSQKHMSYEVELKFPVDDTQEIVARLIAMGATPGETVQQSDTYFNHPSRDFGETDEAFRIRTVNGRHRVTYKGPLVDSETKTRKEVELPFGEQAEDGERLTEILTALGFWSVRTVTKTRTLYALDWEGRAFEACVDDVLDLGTFVELETSADDDTLDTARDSIQRFAAALGLENSERRSYLVLLMEQDNS